MSTSNSLLTYLPSRRTAMQVLLYPLLLLFKIVVVLWKNELPGRDRKAIEVTRDDIEVGEMTSHSSTHTSTMSTSKPLTSRRTAMPVPLYPLLLLFKIVVVLWRNELPGRDRKAVEVAHDDSEVGEKSFGCFTVTCFDVDFCLGCVLLPLF